MAKRLHTVTLIDTSLCQGCRFNKGPTVIEQGGKLLEVGVTCSRLDCDNWDTTTAKKAELATEPKE